MKLVRSLLLPMLCSCAMWPQKTPAQQSRTSSIAITGLASIAGTVVDSITGKPLNDAHIMLFAVGSSGRPTAIYGAMSDTSGHFSIQELPPASYFILLEHRGLIQVPGKGDVAKNAAELKPGQRLQNVILQMAPRSIIAGRVLDEYGDPMMGVSIEAIPVSGSIVANFFGRFETDDRGEFRLVVPPGKYYVKARLWGASTGVTEVRSDGTVESDFLETYYPEATTTDSATPIEIRAGRELDDLEIHMAKSPVLNIGGTVVGIPDDVVSLGLSMAWGPSRSEIHSGNTGGWSAGSHETLTDKFQFGHLAPGFYRIYASCSSGGLPLQSQVAEVSLADASIEDLRLTLAPGFQVTGTVEWTKTSSMPVASAEKRTVKLMPTVGGFFSTSSLPAELAADGAFTMKTVFADRYRVLVEPLPENGFVKAVQLNGAPVPDGMLDFSNGAEGARLKITLSANGGQISGKVEGDKASVPLLFTYVVLYPDLPDLPSREQLLFTRLSDGGSYSFHGIPPGRYRLLAMPSEVREYIHDTLKRYRGKADVIEIKEGDNISRNLKIAEESDGEAPK